MIKVEYTKWIARDNKYRRFNVQRWMIIIQIEFDILSYYGSIFGIMLTGHLGNADYVYRARLRRVQSLNIASRRWKISKSHLLNIASRRWKISKSHLLNIASRRWKISKSHLLNIASETLEKSRNRNRVEAAKYEKSVKSRRNAEIFENRAIDRWKSRRDAWNRENRVETREISKNYNQQISRRKSVEITRRDAWNLEKIDKLNIIEH